MGLHKVKGQKAPNITVQVREPHIANGLRNNSAHCMGVLAVQDAVPNNDAKYVSVRDGEVRVTLRSTNKRHTYPLPYSAIVKVAKYDNGKKIQPFSFRLNGAMALTREAGSKHRTDLRTDRHTKNTKYVTIARRPTVLRMDGATVFRNYSSKK